MDVHDVAVLKGYRARVCLHDASQHARICTSRSCDISEADPSEIASEVHGDGVVVPLPCADVCAHLRSMPNMYKYCGKKHGTLTHPRTYPPYTAAKMHKLK